MKALGLHRLAAALALAVVASSCGAPTESTAEDAHAEVAPDAEEISPSPLEALLGVSVFPQDQDSEEALLRRIEVEELVALCMAAEGFEYVPWVSRADSRFSQIFSGSDTASWVLENGYGFISTIEQLPEVDELEEVSPNEAIVQRLAPDESNAYFDALQGPAVPTDAEATLATPDGCFGDAFEEVNGREEEVERVVEEFGAELFDVIFSIDQHPEIAAFDDRWSSCMREQGYDFDTQNDARQEVLSQLLPIDLEVFGEPTLSESAIPTGFSDLLTDEHWVALREVKDAEIALATLDFSCSEGRAEAEQRARAEIEQDFIDQNQDVLFALLEGR